MVKQLEVRPLSEDEQAALERLSRSGTAAARKVERAKMILWAAGGESGHSIAQRLKHEPDTIYRWLHRFEREGLAALEDKARPGRPAEYSQEERGKIIAAARTKPEQVGQAVGHWTLDVLVKYVNEELGIGISRAQLARVLEQEGLKWYQEKVYFTERPDPLYAEKRGP
jgi:transposase